MIPDHYGQSLAFLHRNNIPNTNRHFRITKIIDTILVSPLVYLREKVKFFF